MNIDSIPILKMEISALKNELGSVRGLLESANSIIIRWDKGGVIRYVNEFGLRFFGYCNEELIGRDIMTLLPKVESATGRNLEELVKDIAMNPDQYSSVPNENITKDGRIVWVSWTNKGLLDEQGNTQEILAIGNDITAQKEAEVELRKSNKDLRLAQRIAGIGNWTLDPEIGVPEWTDEIYRIFERDPDFGPYSLDEYKQAMEGKSLERFTSAIQRASQEGQPYDLEVKVTLASGKAIWVHSICEPEQKLNSKGYYLRGTVQDITERKRIDAELLKIERLQSIGMLAGGIAHDFNNVLTGLYGNISLAKMKLAHDHPGFRFLEMAEKTAQRSTRLTSRLLTFAKGGAPVRENLSLDRLVEEIVSFNLTGSNVKLAVSVADNLWLASVDQEQMQQVFANLAINAREAMPDGGHLNVSIENTDHPPSDLDGGKYLRVVMTDEGSGIAPEYLTRIFDLYSTTKESGRGLGLATAYSIINKHGGHISCSSQLGNGTTFTIYLPASEKAKPSLKRAEPVSAPINKVTRVLVLDDEEMICSLLRDLLGELGFVAETAAEGRQAIEMYQQAMVAGEPFAVTIVDLTIPGGMGGEEAAKGILQIDPEAKIIVSSGYANNPVMANYSDYGFKGVAAKPFNVVELSGVLAEVLAKD